MQTSFYPEPVMRHLLAPLNTGTMVVDNNTVFMAEIGDITKSVKIELYFKIDNGIIEQVKYLVYGNGYIIAALSHLSAELPGLRTVSAMNYSMTNLASTLEIPATIAPILKLIKKGLENIVEQYLAIHAT